MLFLKQWNRHPYLSRTITSPVSGLWWAPSVPCFECVVGVYIFVCVSQLLFKGVRLSLKSLQLSWLSFSILFLLKAFVCICVSVLCASIDPWYFWPPGNAFQPQASCPVLWPSQYYTCPRALCFSSRQHVSMLVMEPDAFRNMKRAHAIQFAWHVTSITHFSYCWI